jgi:hypothetical protein
MKRKTIKRVRVGAAMTLHHIARPYFGYPPLEESWWYLPTVVRWEAWYPPEDAELTRKQWKLEGAAILPSLVRFPVMRGKYLHGEQWEKFTFHLLQHTGYRWSLDMDKIAAGYVLAECLSRAVKFDSDDGMTTHSVALPAPTPTPRVRLGRLLPKGSDRELSAPGHSADEAARRLDMPTLRASLPEPPRHGQSFTDMRKEIES